MVDTDFAWRLTQGLVRIDSSDPGAYEGEIERYIKALVEERLAQLNHPVLDAVQIAELEVLPGRRDLMVTVPGLSDEPRLVYICHMDTVTLGDGWDADITPLGAIVRDDKLYGRGACDMKGGLACAIAALVHTLERVALQWGRGGGEGALPRRGFSLICSVDEEDFMRGSEAAIDAGWVGSREWVLDTEPTDGQIQVDFGVTERTFSNISVGEAVSIEKGGNTYEATVTEIGSMEGRGCRRRHGRGRVFAPSRVCGAARAR